MEVEALKDLCGQGEYVILSMPPPPSKGSTFRLHRTHGPRGEIICVQQNGRSTVRFRSDAVLRSIAKSEKEESEGA